VSELNPTPAQAASFWQGAKDSQAIIFTYLPVSFAFGVSATQFGFSAWEALFLSCSMYAGASQFLVVSYCTACFTEVTSRLFRTNRNPKSKYQPTTGSTLTVYFKWLWQPFVDYQ
jgi:hypothetical protein